MIRPSLAAARGRLSVLALLAVLLLTAGCAAGPQVVTPEPPPIPQGGSPVPEENEVVLSDGTQLVADAPWGRIKIEAGPGTRRVYSWRGFRRGVILEPRDERFAGSMGIHYEGEPSVWEPADGITKVDLEEGQRRFETMDDAMIWMQIRRLRYSYNNSGLVVGWKPDGDTLQVEVWQFYIDGKQPTSMPEADDTRITTGPVEVVPQKMKSELLFADGHREPYTPAKAAQYSMAGSSAAGTSKTASSSPASDCNWFKRLFGQCSAASAEVAESATQDKAQNTAVNGATAETSAVSAAAAASQGAASATAPAASGNATDSTAGKDKETKDANDAPRAKIAGNVVNVRSRPSTDSDVLSQAKEGDSVVILKKDRDWRYVKFDDGSKGWVANFLLDHKE